jgi:hypothetical protein
MSARSSIREQIKKDFGVDLPIIGGSGQSIDDPLVIDPQHRDWADVEYTYLKCINLALNRKYKVVTTSLIEHKGKKIDQLKLEVEGDTNNYHNYYFDVTNHLPKLEK